MRPDQIRAAFAQCVRDLEDSHPGKALTSVAFAKSAIEFLDALDTPEEAPVLHLNGSSGDVLAAGYDLAIEKVGDALEAVRATVPHGRDYYVKGAEAIQKALGLHEYRVRTLEMMQHQLKGLYYNVRTQQEARKKARS